MNLQSYRLLKKIFCLSFIFFLISKNGFSQSGKSTVIPPSPTAATLGAVADVPISLYTGTPNIDFPLYNLSCGSVNVPVSISYNAKGIKVEDVSTGIGVGWMLNAGGVVTRSIRGAAEGAFANEPSYTIGTGTYPTVEDFSNVQQWAFQGVGERDIFYYNFNGYSGSFYIVNGQVKLRKHEEITIEVTNGTNGDIASFLITTPDGTAYEFSVPSGNGTAVTDWNLKKITSSNGTDYIMFEYKDAGSRLVAPRNSRYYEFNYTNATPNLVYNTPADMYAWEGLGLVVSKITSSRNDVIAFNYKPVTYDVTPGIPDNRISLDEMVAYDMYGQKVKTIDFDVKTIKTSQPYANAYPAYPYVGLTNTMDYRDYLESFSEIGTNGETITHSFEYYGRTADGKDGLPNNLSYAQDREGFYNGKNDNYGLIPTFSGYLNPFNGDFTYGACEDSRYPTDLVTIPGSDRSPDIDYMTMGTIKSIKYPTGGKTEFHYTQKINPNGQVPYYGFNVSEIDYIDISGQVVKRKKYQYDDATLGHNEPPFYSYTWNKFGTSQISITPFCTCGNFPVGGDCDYQAWRTTMELSPGPKLDLGLYEGPMIGYGTVTEYEDGNGKTVYTYSNESGESDVLSHEIKMIWNANGAYPGLYIQRSHFWGDFWPLGPFPNNSWKRGTLLSKKTYDQSGNYLAGTEYGYTFQELETINSIKFHTTWENVIYMYYPYSVKTSWIRLDHLTEFKDGVTKVTNYAYDGINHRQKTSEWFTASDGLERKTTFAYPMEKQSGGTPNVYNEMLRRHITAPVIEKRQYKNSVFTQGENNTYDVWSNGNWGGPLTTSMILPRTSEYLKGTDVNVLYRNQAFDNVGNLLSASAENDVRKSYIWGYKSSYPIAEVLNANESEIFYDGFEESGSWDGVIYDNARAHTGKYAARIDNPNSNEIYYHSLKWLSVSLPATKRFKYSGWVYSTGPSVELFLFMKNPGETNYFTYVDLVATNVTNQWVYLEKEVDVPASITQLNIRVDNNGGGTVWYDDIRLCPANAKMTSYTYAPQIGMTSSLDINNRSTSYEYDGFRRLTLVRDKDRNILKRFCYNYAGQQSTCNFVGNEARSKVFYKAGCDAASGKYGSAVTYAVPENTYFGVTKGDANALADAEINAKGQAYANAKGTCLQGETNDPKSGIFTRTNCGYRGTGGPATYVVNAGKYAAATKGEANQLADADVAANGQGYANTAGGCTFTSEPQNVPFFKSNCTNGGSGSYVIYPVADGKYTSAISVADANAKALNEANTYGPGYANTHGYCYWLSAPFSDNFYNQNCTGSGIALPYYISVSLGQVTSLVSQADADARARQYAQDQANTYGECINSGTQFYYQNYGSETIYAQLVNTADASLNYFVQINPYSSGDFFIKIGYYTVTMWPSNTSNYHDYTVGCDDMVLGNQDWQYIFSEPIWINEGCNSMSVSGFY